MKTQATQKKKLTLKTQKAGASGAQGGAADTQPAAAPAAPAAAAAGGPVQVNTRYHTPAVIMAIIATLAFLALITLQALEWYYYVSPPSVWPAPPAASLTP